MNFKYLAIVLTFICLLLSKFSISQINTQYNLGSSMGILNLDNITFTGPISMNSTTSCLNISNGVAVMYNRNNTASEFKSVCDVAANAKHTMFSVYPNPTSSYILISIKNEINARKNYELAIISAKGEIVYTSKGKLDDLNGKKIGLEKYSSGLYGISIITEDGKHNFKILKVN